MERLANQIQPWGRRAFLAALLSAGVAFAGAGGEPAAAKKALINVGDKAPEFSLPAQDGSVVALKDFARKKSVVLYFYPKDNVLVCKKEACLFRDQYQDFVDAGAEVLGVSSDSIESHKKFAKEQRLPFKLLSDHNGVVRKLYGVPLAAGGMLPGRETFVIDSNGIVKLTFNSLLHADRHVNEALRILKSVERKDAASN